jgi:hypothetical protein
MDGLVVRGLLSFGGNSMGGLDAMYGMLQDLFPHPEWAHQRAMRFEACKN